MAKKIFTWTDVIDKFNSIVTNVGNTYNKFTKLNIKDNKCLTLQEADSISDETNELIELGAFYQELDWFDIKTSVKPIPNGKPNQLATDVVDLNLTERVFVVELKEEGYIDGKKGSINSDIQYINGFNGMLGDGAFIMDVSYSTEIVDLIITNFRIYVDSKDQYIDRLYTSEVTLKLGGTPLYKVTEQYSAKVGEWFRDGLPLKPIHIEAKHIKDMLVKTYNTKFQLTVKTEVTRDFVEDNQFKFISSCSLMNQGDMRRYSVVYNYIDDNNTQTDALSTTLYGTNKFETGNIFSNLDESVGLKGIEVTVTSLDHNQGDNIICDAEIYSPQATPTGPHKKKLVLSSSNNYHHSVLIPMDLIRPSNNRERTYEFESNIKMTIN